MSTLFVKSLGATVVYHDVAVSRVVRGVPRGRRSPAGRALPCLLTAVLSLAAPALGHGEDCAPGWTVRSPSSPQVDLRDVARGADVLVAVGENGTIVTSPDARQWTLRESGTTATLERVAWSGARFVAAGRDAMVTSLDGVQWSPVPSPVHGPVEELVWGGTRFVTVSGSSGGIASSPDGLRWAWAPPTATYVAMAFGIAWTGSRFVITGLGYTNETGHYPVTLSSGGGAKWTVQRQQPPGAPMRLAANGERFAGVRCQGGALCSSADAVAWSV